jgi:ectoine hydroxylase-related dioxygenase (phytanoyl-CoA dioxygenase family)
VHLDEWCRVHKNNPGSFNCYPIPNDPWYRRLQHVPLKKGQCVIFDTGSLHANFANRSDKFRVVQFVRMIDNSFVTENRKKHFPQKEEVPENIILSDLGMKLLGLEKWKKK